MTWIALAQTNTPPDEAARVMRCDPRQAERRLEEARYQITERLDNCLAAAALLQQSGFKNPTQKPTLSARHWQDVALFGLTQPA